MLGLCGQHQEATVDRGVSDSIVETDKREVRDPDDGAM